jgi:hypothetical protein
LEENCKDKLWYFEKGAGCGWSRNPICKNLKDYDAKFGREKQDKTSYLKRQHLENYDARFGKERQNKTSYLRKFLVVMLWLEPQKPKNIVIKSLGKKCNTKCHI